MASSPTTRSPPSGPRHGPSRRRTSLRCSPRTGSGRSWVDEILWTARLSPFKRGDDLDADDAAALRAAILERLGGAIEHYEQVVRLPIPDKLPLPLQVHRHEGE